jgi:type II secretory pathway component PulF
MPAFTYSAHGPNGIVTGTLTASDRGEAFALLGKQRLQPFKLEIDGKSGTSAGSKTAVTTARKAVADAATNGPIKLKLAQVVLFVEELSDLIAAGIQLEPALGTMERRRELSGIKTLAAVLRSKVRDGMSFSKAVAATSPSFGNLFCSLASAGEASGSLDKVLKRQAAYLRSQQALRSKILFAMIYPAFLIVAALSVTTLFVVYLIPQLMELLDSTGGSLPTGALIILKISDAVKQWWWLLLIGGVSAFILFKAWAARPESEVPYAKLQLRLPLFGSVLNTRFHVQFLETLANLVGNGLSMMQAMQLTQQATDNAFLRRELDGVIRHVAEGVPLSRALDRSGHFPPLLIDIVSVGEQTGHLAEALDKGAERFDRELGKRIDKMTAMIQPAIVCLMAGLVGVMAYMMITTIFQTISSMK